MLLAIWHRIVRSGVAVPVAWSLVGCAWPQGGGRTAAAERGRTPTLPTVGDEAADTGRVTGRLLARGAPASEARVKLTPMGRGLGTAGWEETLGAEPVASTGADGAFEIRAVLPGAYRLKWLAPGATHWIKRLKDTPDVLVEAGRAHDLGAVEVGRRVR